MTLANFLHMLLGAGLVAFGVLAHAAAMRLSRDASLPSYRDGLAPVPVPAPSRANRKVPTPRRRTESVVPDAVLPATATAPPRAKVANVRPASVASDAVAKDDAMAKDVIAALVSAGYRKSAAAAAVFAVPPSECTTLESWTVAALRCCARGGRA